MILLSLSLSLTISSTNINIAIQLLFRTFGQSIGTSVCSTGGNSCKISLIKIMDTIAKR